MLCVFKIQFILILLQIAAGCNNIKYLNTDREPGNGKGICVSVWKPTGNIGNTYV